MAHRRRTAGRGGHRGLCERRVTTAETAVAEMGRNAAWEGCEAVQWGSVDQRAAERLRRRRRVGGWEDEGDARRTGHHHSGHFLYGAARGGTGRKRGVMRLVGIQPTKACPIPITTDAAMAGRETTAFHPK